MRRNKNRRTKRQGFTLMEMLVVLGILVLLLGMVVPKVLSSSKKADKQSTQSQIQFLYGCLNQYVFDMKNYPTTEQGLEALITPSGGSIEDDETMGSVSSSSPTSSSSASSRWDGPYTETGELPVDVWGNVYQYEYPSTHGKGDRPDIWSFGPDGEDGTEDDIVSWKKDGLGADGEGDAFDDELNLDDELGTDFDLDTEMDFNLDSGVGTAGNFGETP